MAVEHFAEVWHAGDDVPAIARDRLEWRPVGGVAPFILPLPELFRPI